MKMKRDILIHCKYCKKLFLKYALPKYRKRKFCSLSCAIKFINAKRFKKTRKKVKCFYCGKEFMRSRSNIKNRIYCNRNCYLKDKTRIKRGKGVYGRALFFKCDYCGKKVGRFKSAKKLKHHYCNRKCFYKAISAKIKLKCDNCKKIYNYNKKMSIDYKLHFCSIKCKKQYFKKYWPLKGDKNPAKRLDVRKKISKAKLGIPRFDMRGKNNWAWQGGISNRPYAFDFNKELKELIRKRDQYKCQLCGAPQEEFTKKLSVHHIDYNKSNSTPKNLITLCIACNSHVNKDRDYWQNYFEERAYDLDSRFTYRGKYMDFAG